MSGTELPTEPATLVQHLIEEAANSGNSDVVHEVFAESVEMLQGGDDTGARTPAEMWSALENLRTAMPDLHHDIETVRHADDRVYVEYTVTGTFEDELELQETVFEPTGEQLSMGGVIVTRFADGEIDGWANFSHAIKGFQDIGIIPSFEELAA